MSELQRLLAVGSESIESTAASPIRDQILEDLVVALLSEKNGFFAFESALLVRPLSRALPPLGVIEWNAPDTWRDLYRKTLPSDCIFFAENIFCEQFGLSRDGVFLFDPETGDLQEVARDLEEWASMIVTKPGLNTGHSLAHEWQTLHGDLRPGERLIPSLPFVLGGEFDIGNLVKKSDQESMLIRAALANQISELPDGVAIKFELIR